MRSGVAVTGQRDGPALFDENIWKDNRASADQLAALLGPDTIAAGEDPRRPDVVVVLWPTDDRGVAVGGKRDGEALPGCSNRTGADQLGLLVPYTSAAGEDPRVSVRTPGMPRWRWASSACRSCGATICQVSSLGPLVALGPLCFDGSPRSSAARVVFRIRDYLPENGFRKRLSHEPQSRPQTDGGPLMWARRWRSVPRAAYPPPKRPSGFPSSAAGANAASHVLTSAADLGALNR
jgi:hypothetical protein